MKSSPSLLAAVRLAMVVTAVVMLAGPSAAADLPEGLAAADALLAEGEHDAAADMYAALAREHPEDARVWLGLGKARHGAGDAEAALAAFDRAEELGAPVPSVAFHSARVHAARGDLEAVRSALERLADNGAKPWGQLQATPELAALTDEPELQEVFARLRPCASEPYRQFDFWVGEWDVHGAAGNAPGRNVITRLHDGCVLRESYVNRSYTGTSMNYYDPGDERWHQLWVDNQGLVLRLSGGWDGESMVLSSDPGASPVDRITWTPRDDGTVRQHWERSADGGETWETVFDGIYRPAAGS